MPLRERHRARVEPSVDHLRHASHRSRAFRAAPRECVDERLVRIEVRRQQPPCVLRESGVAPDGLDVSAVIVAHPHWKRRSPIPISGDRPIDVVLEPFAESTRADFGRMPVHAVVPRDHVVLVRGRLHEPGAARVVQQWRVTAPTVRIRVRDLPRLPQHAALFELVDQQRIRLLDEHAADDGQIFRKLTASVHRLQERKTVFLPSRVVVRSERRRHVHHAAPILRRDEVSRHDDLVPGVRGILEPVERPTIPPAQHVAAAQPRHDVPALLPVRAKHSRHAPFGEDQRRLVLVAAFDLDVLEIRMHRERDV